MGRDTERRERVQQRSLEARQKGSTVRNSGQQAIDEVALFEAQIAQLITIHHDSGPVIDWAGYASRQPPEPPTRNDRRERTAREQLESYRPGFWAKMFGRAAKRTVELTDAVQDGRHDDEREFERARSQHEADVAEHVAILAIADDVLAGRVDAMTRAAAKLGVFDELSELGCLIDIDEASRRSPTVNVTVRSDVAVPKQQKSILASGKVSSKAMPIGRFNEIYQDYVCSAAIRVGREMHSAFDLDCVTVNAWADLLDAATGRTERACLLSARMPRSTLMGLNFDQLDPSEAMRNFTHKMGFKKSAGMAAVVPLADE